LNQGDIGTQELLLLAARLRDHPLWQVSIKPAQKEGARGWTTTLFIDSKSGEVVKQVRR
jgi:hypothetical protein